MIDFPVISPYLENIPWELKDRKQWVCWKLALRNEDDEKPTKIPFNARTGRHAKTSAKVIGEDENSKDRIDMEAARRTWSPFPAAEAAYTKSGQYQGVGFVFDVADPYTGIDLDDCVNPDTSEIAPWADRIIELLDTYTERSPSGTGVKMVLRGSLPGDRRRRGNIEMYDCWRFFTLTGKVMGNRTIESRQEQLNQFYAEIFPPQEKRQKGSNSTGHSDFIGDDDEIMRIIQRSEKQGAKFDALMNGNTSGKPGNSEAVAALVWMLAWYTDDAAQIDRIVRRSAFVSGGPWSEKWDRLGDTEIEKALNRVDKGYSPPKLSAGFPQAESNPRDFARRLQKQTEAKSAKEVKEEAEEDAERTIPEIDERPVIIVTGRQQREISDDAFVALENVNKIAPTLFSRNRGIVVLSKDRKGITYTQNLTTDGLEHRFRRVADWVSVRQDKERGEVYSSAPVPRWLSADILNSPEIEDRVPALKSIAGSPVVTASGRILCQHGYDEESGIYISCPDVPLPQNITRQDAIAAAERLFGKEKKIREEGEVGEDGKAKVMFTWEGGLFSDFPFASRSDRANAAAQMLTPLLRPYIRGSVPMGVIEAPSPGTGKTLLASCFFRITSPGFTMTDTPSERERGAAEEWSKLIPAVLSGSPAVVLFDNLRGPVSSSSLEATLTAQDTITFRRMGKSDETLTRDVSGVTFAATGNNAVFSRDMARRCYFIRLDAGVERPESRKDFHIPDIEDHIGRNRDELLQDALTIVSGWIAEGRPKGKARKGSFDHWAATLSGVLDTAGIEGFLANDEQRAEASDPETLAWKAFTEAWWNRDTTHSVTAKDLLPLAIEHEIVNDSAGSSRTLGKRLSAVRDRVFGDYRIASMSGAGGINKFSLRKIVGAVGAVGVVGVVGVNTEDSHAKKTETESDTCNTHLETDVKKSITPTTPTHDRTSDYTNIIKNAERAARNGAMPKDATIELDGGRSVNPAVWLNHIVENAKQIRQEQGAQWVEHPEIKQIQRDRLKIAKWWAERNGVEAP